MFYIYPAIFHQNDDSTYTVIFPDLPGCITEGKNLADAIYMARDAMAGWIDSMLKNNDSINPPSNVESIKVADNEFVNLIDADLKKQRRLWDNQAVKRTLSLPKWLDSMAIDAQLSLSKVLQEALYDKLGIDPN